MIWNEDLLFLHPQKTAGMAISTVLLRTLRRPVFNSLPAGHWPTEKDLLEGVAYVDGLRHENIYQANEILRHFRLSVEAFKSLVVVMRNPYDMEVSRYYHLRKPEAFERNEERELAINLSFHEFLNKSRFRSPRPHNAQLEFKEAIKNFYSIGAKFPENLQIIKYENLEADLNAILSQHGYDEVAIPRLNVSRERESRTSMEMINSSEMEELVYRKYAWIFDQGFYPRLTF